MRVLIIKTSSLGDVIHTLPALTDAGKQIPDIRFHWVIEESMTEIPQWHPLVDKIIPVAYRRWRRTWLRSLFNGEVIKFIRSLRAERYDLVLDAQGLAKSALFTFMAKGTRAGLDKDSIRESFASHFYQKQYTVSRNQQAVYRNKQLFAQALDYILPENIDYGINKDRFVKKCDGDYVVFLHGTTWTTKHWPENYWQQLAKLVDATGMKIKLPWGNPKEQQRAEKIAACAGHAEVLPKMNLSELASIIAHAKAVVAVDTGLGHLAAALHTPTLSLYGPTNSQLTGTVGPGQQHLVADFVCSPCLQRECTYTQSSQEQPACFTTLQPEKVWQALQKQLNNHESTS